MYDDVSARNIGCISTGECDKLNKISQSEIIEMVLQHEHFNQCYYLNICSLNNVQFLLNVQNKGLILFVCFE